MAGGIESTAYLDADFNVGDVVLVEHDVVSLLVEPLRSVAPEKAPHLVQHRPPDFRELRPRRSGRYHRGRRRIDGLHGHLNSHGAEPTPSPRSHPVAAWHAASCWPRHDGGSDY